MFLFCKMITMLVIVSVRYDCTWWCVSRCRFSGWCKTSCNMAETKFCLLASHYILQYGWRAVEFFWILRMFLHCGPPVFLSFGAHCLVSLYLLDSCVSPVVLQQQISLLKGLQVFQYCFSSMH